MRNPTGRHAGKRISRRAEARRVLDRAAALNFPRHRKLGPAHA